MASKFAAGFDFVSVGFVVCYVLVLVVLAGYALGWQQVIKRMPLTTAYANRGITVVWGIFWGAVFFGEAVTPFKLLGAAMIIAGIALFSHADAAEDAAAGANGKTAGNAAEGAAREAVVGAVENAAAGLSEYAAGNAAEGAAREAVAGAVENTAAGLSEYAVENAAEDAAGEGGRP